MEEVHKYNAGWWRSKKKGIWIMWRIFGGECEMGDSDK